MAARKHVGNRAGQAGARGCSECLLAYAYRDAVSR